MKKILVVAGCLFLSACSSHKPVGHLYVRCWQRDPNGNLDTVIYSGKINGGIGMGETKDGKISFITFKDELDERQDIMLTNRVCVATVYSIDYPSYKD